MLYNCIQVKHQLYNDLRDNAEYQQWRFNQHDVFILFVRFNKTQLFINIWFIFLKHGKIGINVLILITTSRISLNLVSHNPASNSSISRSSSKGSVLSSPPSVLSTSMLADDS